MDRGSTVRGKGCQEVRVHSEVHSRGVWRNGLWVVEYGAVAYGPLSMAQWLMGRRVCWVRLQPVKRNHEEPRGLSYVARQQRMAKAVSKGAAGEAEA